VQWLQRRNSRKKSQHWIQNLGDRLLVNFCIVKHNPRVDGGMTDTACFTPGR